MKKMIFFILLIFLEFSVQISYAYDARIEYDEIFIDYSGLSYDYWKKEGNNYLYSAQKAKLSKDKLDLYGKAAAAYLTTTKINPGKAENMAILGHIYGKMNQPTLAQSYLDRAINLEIRNPLVNKYYGIFHEDERNYRKAAWYYKLAYQNGMYNDYELNYNLGNVYAKIGELQLSKLHYSKAYSLKPSKILKNKIRLLDELKKT